MWEKGRGENGTWAIMDKAVKKMEDGGKEVNVKVMRGLRKEVIKMKNEKTRYMARK